MLLKSATLTPQQNGAQEYRASRVELPEAPRCQILERNPLRPLRASLVLGDSTFAVSIEAKIVRVATSVGKAPSTSLTTGKKLQFRWREGESNRQAELRFIQAEDQSWMYFAAEAKRFEIMGIAFDLIDSDANGVYGDLERDGYRAYGSQCVCPLRRELTLGAHRVVFESIAADGSRLTAHVTAVAGNTQQLATLFRINQLRAENGLSPVSLDQELSARTTSHANYLAVNQWTGLTNPHDQSLGPEGKSADGKIAAQRSAISKSTPIVAFESFWATYYHRINLMSQTLTRVGINAEPDGIAVIDAAEGLELNTQAWPCVEPIFVPADGAVRVPTKSRGELPTEPVSQLESRGFCLMVAFLPRQAGVTNFSGVLEELGPNKTAETKTLLADQGDWKWIFGVVPEQPLKSQTKYRATFKYTKGGQAVTRAVVFQTE